MNNPSEEVKGEMQQEDQGNIKTIDISASLLY